jgi:hypothetical protein
MLRFIAAVVAVASAGGLLAAPGPATDTKTLVAGLSDPDEKVRDASVTALKDRADALPWLRRATRSADQDTARRAAALLAPYEPQRQGGVAKAIDACIRDGCLDLLTELHQYWKPRAEEDLWPVGPRAAKAGQDLLAKSVPKEAWAEFEKTLTRFGNEQIPRLVHNDPWPKRFQDRRGLWLIRTDRIPSPPAHIKFASVTGRTWLGSRLGGDYLVIGSIRASELHCAFVACDGDVWYYMTEFGNQRGVDLLVSIVVCRGNFTGASRVRASVLLVDGDIDLSRSEPWHSVIRASGEIRLDPNVKAENCTIEAHAKNATAPYKFFELTDVGLSLADDEEGLVVTAAKADTPFGNCGLAKGDVILAIDDAPAGHSEEFRKAVRRALVRQGDCLLTVARGGKTLDLPVFFPLPK